jgi:hypothetical protein
MKELVSCLLVFTLMCPALWSDPVPNQKHIDHIQKKISESITQHRIVVIDTYDHRRLQGLVSEADADGFVLAIQGTSTTLKYAQVEKVGWSPRVVSTVGNAAKFGIVAGVVTIAVLLLVIGIHD